MTTTTAPARLKEDYVPTSYADLFNHYYDYVVRFVVTQGIYPKNAEDVAMSILTTFFEKDVLSQYSPDHVSNRKEAQRHAKFRTLLSGFVAVYVRHYRDRQGKLIHREGFSTETPVSMGSESGTETTWIEVADTSKVEDRSELDAQDFLQQIRVHLHSVPPLNSQDLCKLDVLFEAILIQTEDSDKVNVAELSAKFGVSKTTIQNWLVRLRREVAVAIGDQ